MSRLGIIAVCLICLSAAGCENMSQQQQRALSGGAIGAVAGGVVGAMAGGHVATGAAIGAAGGAAIGALIPSSHAVSAR